MALTSSAHATIICDAESTNGCQFNLERLSSLPVTISNLQKGKRYTCYALPNSLIITNINFTFANMIGMSLSHGDKASILNVDTTQLKYQQASLYFDIDNQFINNKIANLICYKE